MVIWPIRHLWPWPTVNKWAIGENSVQHISHAFFGLFSLVDIFFLPPPPPSQKSISISYYPAIDSDGIGTLAWGIGGLPLALTPAAKGHCSSSDGHGRPSIFNIPNPLLSISSSESGFLAIFHRPVAVAVPRLFLFCLLFLAPHPIVY
jgi:hypothetical protein